MQERNPAYGRKKVEFNVHSYDMHLLTVLLPRPPENFAVGSEIEIDFFDPRVEVVEGFWGKMRGTLPFQVHTVEERDDRIIACCRLELEKGLPEPPCAESRGKTHAAR